MRVGEVRGLQAESTSIPIHFLNEILHRLVGRDAPLVHICLRGIIVFAILVLAICSVGAIFALGTNGATADAWTSTLSWLAVVLFIIFVSRRHLEQVLPEVLCQAYTCIVATREHEAVQQVPNG